jgi:hypothetical protein
MRAITSPPCPLTATTGNPRRAPGDVELGSQWRAAVPRALVVRGFPQLCRVSGGLTAPGTLVGIPRACLMGRRATASTREVDWRCGRPVRSQRLQGLVGCT